MDSDDLFQLFDQLSFAIILLSHFTQYLTLTVCGTD